MSSPATSRPATSRPAREPARDEPPERPSRLWLIALSPAVWALHFLACYATAAIWCAKSGAGTASGAAPLGPVRVAVAVYTLIALAVVGANGWRAWRRLLQGGAGGGGGIDDTGRLGDTRGGAAGRRHQDGNRADLGGPHDADTPRDRERFLALATLLLSGLSLVATVFTALAAVFIGDCR